jgi:hypothetical protein
VPSALDRLIADIQAAVRVGDDTRFYRCPVSLHMTPTLTLDRFLKPAEAASWLARVSPARQDDLVAVNGKSRS